MDDKAFISYAKEDKDKALKLYDQLKNNGINVWIDIQDLKIGHWKTQIEKTISQSKYFIICLSENAMRKTGNEPGFQDEELNYAYTIAQKQASNSFVIIPVRFEECGRGDHRLATFQQFDIFEDWEGVVKKLIQQISGSKNTNVISESERRIDELMGKVISDFYANEFSNANKILDSIIIVFGEVYKALLWKGLIQIQESKYEEAISTNIQALKVKPNDTKALNNIGVAYFNLHKYEDALNYFNKVLEIDNKRPLAWYNKGYTLINLKKYDEIIDCYQNFIKLQDKLETDNNHWKQIVQIIRDGAIKILSSKKRKKKTLDDLINDLSTLHIKDMTEVHGGSGSEGVKLSKLWEKACGGVIPQ